MRRPPARLLLPLVVAAGIALAHPWDVASPAATAGAGPASGNGPTAVATDLASIAPQLAGASVDSSEPAALQLIDPLPSPIVASTNATAGPSGPFAPVAPLPSAGERRHLQNDLVPADPSTLTGYAWPDRELLAFHLAR